MKKAIYFLLFSILFIGLYSCSFNNKQQEVITIKESDIVQKNIKVKGMTCVGCEITLEENLSKIKGVVHVKASHKKENAIIKFDSTKTSLPQIKKAIKKSGYQAF